MANRIPFGVITNFGASGSSYGSELLINVAVGPNYLSASSQALLGASLPGWVMFTVNQPGAVAFEYTPDSGTTWRRHQVGSGALLYVESTGTTRLFGINASNVFAVPIKA